MAESTPKKSESKSDSKGYGATEYVVEHAPKLPLAGVDVSRDEPAIDRRLIEMRNEEAKVNANRVK